MQIAKLVSYVDRIHQMYIVYHHHLEDRRQLHFPVNPIELIIFVFRLHREIHHYLNLINRI